MTLEAPSIFSAPPWWHKCVAPTLTIEDAEFLNSFEWVHPYCDWSRRLLVELRRSYASRYSVSHWDVLQAFRRVLPWIHEQLDSLRDAKNERERNKFFHLLPDVLVDDVVSQGLLRPVGYETKSFKKTGVPSRSP